MSATLTIDTREFNKTLNEYILHNRRDLADSLNIKMFLILKRARELTPLADRKQILADMGAEDVSRVSKKTGKTKTSFRIAAGKANPWKILNYWAKKKGWTFEDAASRRKAARKLIARRLGAIGTLQRGWNLSLKKFAAAAKMSFDVGKGKVKQKGSATVAQPGWNPVAEAEYSLAITKGGDSSFHIDPRVEEALATAFAEESQSMKDYIARKMQERLSSMK